MSTYPASSVPDPKTQEFPVLNEQQIDALRKVGEVRRVKKGDVLFSPGDATVPFFVLLSGKLEISQPDAVGGHRHLVTHEAGQFTGEISMISGQRSLALGVVTEDGECLLLTSQQLREIVARNAELGEIFLRAFILRRIDLNRHGLGNAVLLGSRHSAQTLKLREFLSRNGYPYAYLDLDTDRESQALLDRFDVKPSEIPVVISNGRDVLRNPSVRDLATRLGLNSHVDGAQIRDVVIAGAGPAGLAAAVYAASEGLDALLIETRAPGGQAGSSSKIENYLGFPVGISGQELAARAITQAQKFGASMLIARDAERLDCEHRPYELVLDGGEVVRARAVIVATGAQYNKPKLDNLEKFEGRGIYYGATYIESQLCENEEVIVVGGGNSAGQAAVFLSQSAHYVHVLVRSNELSSTMSRYLIQRLTENPQIELHFQTQIVALHGDDELRSLVWRRSDTGEESERSIRHVFIMAGASPRTAWLQGCLAMDEKGFLITGRDLTDRPLPEGSPRWKLERPPEMLETSSPGVFAIGDVRAGNVKRVASAVGEGAMCIHVVHKALAEV